MNNPIFIFIACSILVAKPVFAMEISDSLKESADSLIITHDDTINTANSHLHEFVADLKASVDAFDSAKSMKEVAYASSQIELIAKKWNDEWVTNYYACYCLTVLSHFEKEESKRDAYLDDAEMYINKAKEIYKSDYDEIYVLIAMVANARLSVDPVNRFKRYNSIFNENIDKAKSIQPNNPRIYYLQGNNFYYTPKMFGGGAKNAVSYFETAEMLYSDEKNVDICKPYWGKLQNSIMLNKCKSEINRIENYKIQ
jgi:hypothetical protein